MLAVKEKMAEKEKNTENLLTISKFLFFLTFINNIKALL